MLEIKTANVLIVEDILVARNSLSKILSSFVNNIYTSSNGLEGLETFKKNHDNIDIVLTDINMPIMDGIEMIENIRQIDKDILIYIITGQKDNDYTYDIKKLSVNDFFLKPLKFELMLNKINKDFVAKNS